MSETKTTSVDPDATRAMPENTDPAATLAIGTQRSPILPCPQVPGYEILGELGRGGMGVVYKARHITLGRMVALKMVLAGEHASDQQLSRLLSEAQSVARLQHPGIVQVFEVGEFQSRPFFSMEFVDGGSLSQRLAGTQQPPREAAEMVLRLARAIQAAHERGIIHRDLKPANILLAADGSPKITDFGLAKQLDSQSGQTQTGDILGTPSYMAPEQASGRVHEIGPGTDVYALGVILYEMLTGRVPFRGQNPIETIRMLLSQESTAPSQLAPKVPRDLETICLKCLQKEPGRRYVSADALANDLQHFLNGEPIQARPVGSVERFGRWCRRNPVVASLTAGTFLSLAIGLSMATIFAIKAAKQAESERNQRGIAERKEREALEAVKAEAKATGLAQLREGEAKAAKTLAEQREKEAVHSATLEKEARGLAERKEKEALVAQAELAKKADALQRQVYRNTISLAYREWQAQNGPQAISLLNSCDPKLRGWEWSYCSRLTRLQQLELRKDPNEEFGGVAFSPDGSRLAGAGERGTVIAWDAVTGRELFSVKYPRPEKATYQNRRVDTLKYSPDGTKLLVAGVDSLVRLLDSRDGKEVATYPGFKFGVCSVAFSPDGRRIAASSGYEGVVESYEVRVWDTESRQQLLNLNGHAHTVTGVVFSPDGRRLASTGHDRRVKVWDLESGREIMNLPLDEGEVFGVTYSRDGQRILVANGDSLVHVWSATTGEKLPPLSGHRNGVRSIAVSPDGRRYATASLDATAAIWNAETGGQLWTLQGHGWNVNSVAFSPDGRRLATAGADRRINVWDVTSDPQYRVLKGHLNPIKALSISQDGRYAATLGPQTTTYPNEYALWDLTSGELIRLDHDFGLSKAGYLPYRSLDFGPGFQLASGASHHAEKQIRVWDALTGRTLLAFDSPQGTVNATALSPDCQTLAIASDDAVVRLLDAKTGVEKLAFRGHESSVSTVLFNHDGTMIASSGPDKTLLWDIGGSVRHTFPAQFSWRIGQRPLCFSRDGKRFATASFLDSRNNPMHGVMTVIDLDTGQKLAELRGHSRNINAAAFSKDGSRIATGSDDNLIKIWDVTGATELLSLRGHTAAVMALQFTPDGTKLITAGIDGATIIWDATPVEKPTWLPDESLPAEAHPIIQQLLARNPNYSGRVNQLKAERGQIVELSFAGQSGLNDLTPLADMRQLRSLDLRGTRVADLAPLNKLPLSRLNLRDTLANDLTPLRDLPLEHLDLRGTSIADLKPLADQPLISLWCDAKARLDETLLRRLPKLDLLNGRPAKGSRSTQQSVRVLIGHHGEVRSVSLHPTGGSVASGGIDGTVRVWSLTNSEGTPVVMPHESGVTSVLYSPDGHWLSWSTGDSCPSSNSGNVWLAPADRPTEKRSLAQGIASVECLAMTSDGRLVAAGAFDGSVRLWNTESGELKATLTGHSSSVLSVAFAPDNKTLAAGTGLWADLPQPGEVRLWNVETGQPIRTLKARQAVNCVSFLEDASQIAVSNWNLSTAILDARTGIYQFDLRAHDGRARWHSLLSHRQTMVTVGGDLNVLLWDISTKEKWATLTGHTAPLWQVSATADSRLLATASSDGTARVWSVPERDSTIRP